MRTAAADLAPLSLALIFGGMLTSVLLGALRFKLIARDAGSDAPFAGILHAVCIGQLAGAALFQVFGRLLARGAILRRSGLSVSTSTLVTLYEQLLALAVSVGLAVAGALYIFGRLGIDLKAGGADLVQLVIGGIAVFAACAWLAWGHVARRVSNRLESGHLGRLCRSLALTVCIQLCTLLAFTAAAAALSPSTSLAGVVAASTIVMFASALPISLAGWGVREMTSVFALGTIGFPVEKAVMTGILLGLAALVTNAVTAVAASLVQSEATVCSSDAPRTRAAADHATVLLGWLIPITAAMAVLFQAQIPVGMTRLNANLADLIVPIGGLLFLVHVWPRAPEWKLPSLNLYIGLMTAVVLLAFMHGLFVIGWSQWAAVNKSLGWFFVLAYGMTGALIGRIAGSAGQTILLRTIAAGVAAVVMTEALTTIVDQFGWTVALQTRRLAGFAYDQNAFAFQIVVAISIVLATIGTWPSGKWLLGLLSAGIWMSGSRSGMIAFAAVLAAFAVLHPGGVRRVAAPIACGLASAAALFVVLDLLVPSSGVQAASLTTFVIREERSHSTAEHLRTVVVGLQQFLQSPVIGNGLGYFIETFGRANGSDHPPDSTAVWLLAEFGVLGFAAFVVPFAKLMLNQWPEAKAAEPAARTAILMLVGFAVMSQFYEITYQRVFWLTLGAVLIMPCMTKAAERAEPQAAGVRFAVA